MNNQLPHAAKLQMLPLSSAESSMPTLQEELDAPLLRLVADSVPVLIAYFDFKEDCCRFANRQYAAYYGWTTTTIIGKTILETVGEVAWRQIEPQVQAVRQGGKAQYTRELVLREGEPRMVEVNLLPHLDDAQQPLGSFVLINDITERWHIEREIRDSEERSAKFAQASSEGLVFHRHGRITDANDAVLRMVGLGLHEVVGRSVLDFIAQPYHALIATHLRQTSEDSYEAALKNRDGHEVPVEITGKTISLGNSIARLVVVRDIMARKLAQQQIEFLAHHDNLTELPNRVYVLRRLEQIVSLPRRADASTAVLFVDLDNFKAVNDSLGHHAGDQVLRAVAQRLRAHVRDSDVVSRLGGDEFLVVLTDIESSRDAGSVANKLLQAIGAAIMIEGQEVNISPSIGISLFPEHGSSAEELVRNADAAMYHAKASGRNNHQVFEPSMRERALELVMRERRLRAALANGEFVLHYQPQWRVSDGTLAGIDALLRWQHPTHGLIAPEQFLDFAESRGLLGSIGIWTVREACTQLTAWQAEGLALVPVAVSLSAIELRQPGIAALIADILGATGLPAHRLELAISEAALTDISEHALHTLDELKSLGVALVLNDFGAGYSFLRFVKRCPLDKLKIDHGLIHEIEGGQQDFALATAVVQVASSMHMLTVAEHVDSAHQLGSLRRMGCDYWQGSLGGDPVDASQAYDWLRAGSVSIEPALFRIEA